MDLDRTGLSIGLEPWRSRPDWSAGRVEPAGGRLAVAVPWFFAIVWNMIAAPLLFIVPRELARGNRMAAIGLLFPAVGLLLVINAIRGTLRWRKFGAATLALRGVPIVPGGRLVGAIRTRHLAAPAAGYRLRLTCARRSASGGGNNRTVSERIVWRDERTMSRALPATDPGTTEIPVSFAIPADAPPTTLDDPGDRILWMLEADAALPGLDFHSEFELPVFAGGPAPPESQAGSKAGSGAAAEDPMEDFAAPEEPFRPASDRGIRVGSSVGGGTEIIVGPWRNPGAALGLLAFLLIWSGALGFLCRLRAPLIFPLAFGAFELLLIYFALDVALGTSRVVIEAGTLRLTRGILGVGPTVVLRCADLNDVRLTIGMQSGDHHGTPYYSVNLIDRDDTSRAAARNIRDKREAEWLAGTLKRLIAAAS